MARDFSDHAFGVAEDVAVPEAEDAVAFAGEKGGAASVGCCVHRVLDAVGFDDRAFRKTEEIGEIRADRHLAPPF